MKISFNCTDDQQVVHTHKDAGLSDQVPCSKPDISPEAYLNDYRNRMPFHYIEEGSDGYYYWQYGSIMDLVINFVDEIAQSEDMPEAVLDVRINDKSVVDPVAGIAHLGSMALCSAADYYTLQQTDKIVGTLFQQIRDLQEGGIASIVDTPKNLMSGQLLMWNTEARRLVGSPLVNGDVEGSIILKTSSSEHNFAKATGNVLLGRGLSSSTPFQTVIGRYNEKHPTALFLVGAGIGEFDRKNALEVMVDGSIRAPQNLRVNGELVVDTSPTQEAGVVRKKELDQTSQAFSVALEGAVSQLTVDLTTTEERLNSQIEAVGEQFAQELGEASEELAGEISNARSELSSSIAEVQTEMQDSFSKCVLLQSTSQTIQGDLAILGSLNVVGENYQTHLQEVFTKNDYIYLREGAASALPEGQYAGIEAVLYDGVNNGRLVFDNTGTARVGDTGEEQPLATRAEASQLVDQSLLLWDALNFRIIDSGISKEYLLRTLDSKSNATNLENGQGRDSIVQVYTGEVDDTHYGNTNTGESAVVFGEANRNSANRALIAGKLNINSGADAFIVGLRNNNAADSSLLVGLENVNGPSDYSSDGGRNSIVAGKGNKNYGFSSIITGNGIINTNKYAIVCGKHNIDVTDAYLIVGNGENSLEGNQSNAFVVYADGRATVQSAPKNATDVIRLADLTASTADNNGYAASFKSLQSHKLPTDRNDVLRLSDLSSGLDAQFGIISCSQVSAGNGGVQSSKLPTLVNDVLRLNDITRHWCNMKAQSLSIGNYLATASNIVLESSGNATFSGELAVSGRATVLTAPREDSDVVRKKELDLSWNSFNIENGEGTDSLVQKYTGEVDDTHFGNTCTGENAAALGEANNITANRSLSVGKLNKISAANSFVGGLKNEIDKDSLNSLAVGESLSVNSSFNSIFGGQENVILNSQRGVFSGYKNNIKHSPSSVIVGTSNTVYGAGNSIICGEKNQALINKTVIAGDLNINKGYDSVVFGYSNKNYGDEALVTGLYNKNNNQGALITGRYNDNKDNTLFEVGNGIGEDITDAEGNITTKKRKNAFEVYRDGRVKVQAAPKDDDDVVRLKELNKISDVMLLNSDLDSEFFKSLY